MFCVSFSPESKPRHMIFDSYFKQNNWFSSFLLPQYVVTDWVMIVCWSGPKEARQVQRGAAEWWDGGERHWFLEFSDQVQLKTVISFFIFRCSKLSNNRFSFCLSEVSRVEARLKSLSRTRKIRSTSSLWPRGICTRGSSGGCQRCDQAKKGDCCISQKSLKANIPASSLYFWF